MTTHVVVIINTIFRTFYKLYMYVSVCVYIYMAKVNKKRFNINIYKNQNVNLYLLYIIYFSLSILYCTILYIFFYILAIPVNRSCI